MVTGRFFRQFKEGIIECRACNHFCKIKKGQRGICGVRQATDSGLDLIVYGKVASAHLDPVEKKPLYHFLPGESVFSIGTLGCNFGCSFCQNWEISQITKKDFLKILDCDEISQGEVIRKDPNEYGFEISPKQIIKYCCENNVKAIAYTYNEPTIFAEFAFDIARLALKSNIKNIFVTNGYMSDEVILEMKGLIQAANIDLKSYSDSFYKKNCQASLNVVLKNIANLYKSGIWIEITTLIIPGENDSDEELQSIARFIAGLSKDIPWHISRFHPSFKMVDKKVTSLSILNRACEIGKAEGLKFIYTGNVGRDECSNTFCPNCQEILIKRDLYTIKFDKKMISSNNKNKRNLEEDILKCPKCSEVIQGVWV